MSEPTHALPRRRGTRGPAPSDEANLRDVAARAGVSPATASRVFSGHATVSEATRAKVLAAADELGYVVNGLAQAMLGTGRRSLAFVTSSMAGQAFADLASGAEYVATTNGNLFLIALTHGDADKEQEIIENLRENRTAGVLLSGSTVPGKLAEEKISAYATALTSVNASLVLTGHPYLPALPNIQSVNYDQIGGVRKAVQLLASKGHSRIAFLGWSNSTTANQRFLGYSLGMKDADLTIDSTLVVECPNEVVQAHLAALLLLKSATPPTAVVCLTDQVALGVYRAAHDFSVSIPDQLAVIGFDDSPFCADLTPSLTSVHAPFYNVGVRAAQLALNLTLQETRVDLPTQLMVRESTG